MGERAADEGAAGAARLVVLAVVGAAALLAWAPATNLDTWHYAASGRWAVEHRAIPRADPFSWTYLGAPWQSNGWLWGVVLWGAWSAAGAAGVAVLKPLGVLATGLAVRWAAAQAGARPGAAACAAGAAVLGVLPWISERPQLLSYVALPLLLGLVWRAASGEALRWRPILVAVGLVVVWVNAHGAAVLGAAVGAATCALLGVRAARAAPGAPFPRLLPYLAASLALLGAVLVNPWGADLFTHAREVRTLSRATIDEWYPLWRAGGIAVVPLAAAGCLAALVVRRRAWGRLELLAAPVLCLVAAVDGVRNAPFAVLAVAVCAAPLVGTRLEAWLADRVQLLRVAVACSLLAAAAVAVPRVLDATDPAPDVPVAAAAALPAGCQLRNDSVLGGWVIFERADVPVSADGRNDLYGLEGYAQAAWFRDADTAPAVAALEDEGTTCVLALPGSPLVPALVEAGWVVVASDGAAVALVAPAG